LALPWEEQDRALLEKLSLYPKKLVVAESLEEVFRRRDAMNKVLIDAGLPYETYKVGRRSLRLLKIIDEH